MREPGAQIGNSGQIMGSDKTALRGQEFKQIDDVGGNRIPAVDTTNGTTEDKR